VDTHPAIYRPSRYRELFLRDKYIAAENRIFRAALNSRLWFSDAQKGGVDQAVFQDNRRSHTSVSRFMSRGAAATV